MSAVFEPQHQHELRDVQKTQQPLSSKEHSTAPSFLSPLVKELILLDSSTTDKSQTSHTGFLGSDRRIRWEKLKMNRLCDMDDSEECDASDATISTEKWYKASKYTHLLALEADKTLSTTTMELLREIFPRALSLGLAPHLLRLHLEYLETKDILLSFSALCTFIERSLGDVFAKLEEDKQQNPKMRRKPPPLVRDLLQTSHLKEFLGADPAFLMRVLIGSPRALNLRNLLWHGFVASHELHPGYYWLLLWLSLDVFERGFDLMSAMTPRPLKDLSLIGPEAYDFGMGPSSILAEDGKDENMKNRIFGDISAVLNTSEFILPFRADTLLRALEYFFRGDSDAYNYYFCLVLLLPALEHCLRAIWVSSNELPSPLLCADSFRYYTVLDMFLETRVVLEEMSVEALSAHSSETVASDILPKFGSNTEHPGAPKSDNASNTPNRLIEIFGDRVLTALNDTFLYPAGPRPRDRISHGDVDPTTVTRCAAARCLEMTVYLALRHRGPSEVPSTLKPCIEYYDNFKSCWHPQSLLQRQLASTICNKFSKWIETILPISTNSNVSNDDEEEEQITIRGENYENDVTYVLEIAERIRSRRNVSGCGPYEGILNYVTLESLYSEFEGVRVPPHTRELQFFDTLNASSLATTGCDGARRLCFELDTIIELWVSKFLEQRAKVESGEATTRLQASFHKHLGVLNLGTCFIAALLLLFNLQLSILLLNIPLIRKLSNAIAKVKAKVELNAWDELASVIAETIQIVDNIVN